MGFGDFVGRMGYTSVGMGAAADQNTQRLRQMQQAEADATRLRLQQQDEAWRNDMMRANEQSIKDTGELLPDGTMKARVTGQVGTNTPVGVDANVSGGSGGYAVPGATPIHQPAQVGGDHGLGFAVSQSNNAAAGNAEKATLYRNNQRDSVLPRWMQVPDKTAMIDDLNKDNAAKGKAADDAFWERFYARRTAMRRDVPGSNPAVKQIQPPASEGLPGGWGSKASAPAIQPGAPVNLQQVAPYLGSLEQQNNLPQGLLRSTLKHESGGVPRPGPVLPNKETAKGYFQFLDGTAREQGVQVNNFQSEAEGAARYLKALYQKHQSWPKAIAAYGGGLDPKTGEITPNGHVYVQKILSGVAGDQGSVVPNQAQAQAPQLLGGTGDAFIGTDTNALIRQQNAVRYRQLQALARSPDPQVAMGAMTEMHKLQNSAQDNAVYNTMRAASYGNTDAINDLIGMWGNTVYGGRPVRLAPTSQEGVFQVIDGQTGRAITGLPPATLERLMGEMGSQVHKGLAEQKVRLSSIQAEEYAKKHGAVAAEHPAKMEELQQQGQNTLTAHQIMANSALTTAMLSAGVKYLELGKMQPVTFNALGEGIAVMGDGSMFKVTVPNDKNALREPKVIQLQGPQMDMDMGGLWRGVARIAGGQGG